MPEPFVKFELENELTKLKLLAKTTGAEGKRLEEDWDAYRRHLAQLAVRGGSLRVRNHVIEPLRERLGYTCEIESGGEVETREGREWGGYLLKNEKGARLRVWTTELDEDLDAPAKRGQAYRFSHLRIAQRVLLACGERVGLLTNGVELRLLISDPARPDSQVVFTLDPNWKRSRDVPDSFRTLLALVCPDGVQKIPELVDKARLQQARVTKDLRDQARQAIGRFIQEVLDHPENHAWLAEHKDREALARALWHEGLVIVYRLLFILKLESSDDSARSFTFASTSLWRNTFSPSMALARYARQVLGEGAETGGLLESGLRGLFRMFHEGIECTELNVKPLGGALFGAAATPELSELRWGERAVAHLLDQLLWTTPKKKGGARERVHYGPLDVEDLGRVYEALLELEPGIASQPMCRLRRQKLEVVVPVAQGEKYRPAKPTAVEGNGDDVDEPEDEEEPSEDDDESPKRGKKTTVQWIEEIAPGRFYLRVGLGRKATGSYYTPHSFVRFLVQETLGPQVAERSPQDDPQPGEILKLKVLDPAMGSGHFLVEACRFLGHHLYEVARLCDENATAAERKAEAAKRKEDREAALAEAQKYRQRVLDLPDPDDELVRYLPSRAVEGEQSGVSQRRAEALCRRLVAVHSLYGVDKNPLAVELAKLALWLESHAEGMPLTFLDHRLVVGDSLTGPFWDKLLMRPSSPEERIEGVFQQGITLALQNRLAEALSCVRHLEATVGISLAEVKEKEAMKTELDQALRPFRILAAAWSGGVMLGPEKCDDFGYAELLKSVAQTGELPVKLSLFVESEGNDNGRGLLAMIARGLGVDRIPADRDALYAFMSLGRCVPALAYDLSFPEVFYAGGVPFSRLGFDSVLGNPPWDKLNVEKRELMASVNSDFFVGKESAGLGEEHVLLREAFDKYPEALVYELQVLGTKRAFPALCGRTSAAKAVLSTVGNPEQYRLFLLRAADLTSRQGALAFLAGGGLGKNPADAPTRTFLFDTFQLKYFVHFVNLRQLFVGASSRISFVVLSGVKSPISTDTALGFELEHSEELVDAAHREQRLSRVDRESIIEQLCIDGDLTKLASSGADFFGAARSVVQALDVEGVAVGNDLNRTNAKPAFRDLDEILPERADAREPDAINALLQRGYVCSYDGRSIDSYDSLPVEKSGKWLPQVSIVADLRHRSVARLHDRLRFYRLAWRATCGHPATNERTARACLLPPGTVAAHSILVEAGPQSRPHSHALFVCSVLNSFPLDFQARRVVQSNLGKVVLARVMWPSTWEDAKRLFLVHGGMRLVAINRCFASLWHEQVQLAWREGGENRFSWPVLAGDDERWEVRAAIDAVVADAYGLSRDQYAHVLSTFSHTSYKKAPELCLARFDELKNLGLEKFTRKYDPYWDIPLNESLPKPVIDLAIPGEAQDADDGEFRLTGVPSTPKRRRGKK